MIRPTEPGDTPLLVEIAEGTGVFRASEVAVLRECLDDYHAGDSEEGHVCLTYVHDDRPAGLAYYVPNPMTDRGWYLWWIVVDRRLQSRGVGGTLIRRVEEDVSGLGGRLLLIETSSAPGNEPTRRFYLRHGYVTSCTVPDYYADGDGLVIFSKRLRPPDPAP